MHAITIKNAWLMYKIPFNINGKISWDKFWVVKDVSFKVDKGEVLGIIGENGAGKSTVLKLIAGLLRPDRGQVAVLGRVAGLLELGAGFQPELTGAENISLSASLFGLTQDQIQARYEQIVEFASLGRFIYAPVKCYSQGMFVRLAFAIAIHMEPDILLIDDTLAVGDEYFQRKCIKKIFELKDRGKTLIFVTHDMNMLRRLCTRAIFLRQGKIVKDAVLEKVIPLYAQTVGPKEGVGILGNDFLKLVFNNGRLFLNWHNALLTPNPGIYTVFCVKDKWYSSLQADWIIEKKEKNKLIVRGQLYQLDLTQIWEIEIINNQEVKLNIEMDDPHTLEIQEGSLNLTLTKEYSRWFSSLGDGKFPKINETDRHWNALIYDNINRNVIGVEADGGTNNELPRLAIERSNDYTQAGSQIFNADYLQNCRVLQHKILGAQNYSNYCGSSFAFFSGKIIIDIKDKKRYLEKIQDDAVLSGGQLKLTFDKGQCAVLNNDIKQAKAVRISSIIYADKKWYSSNTTAWELKRVGTNKLIVTGKWLDLPIVQIWEIEIENTNSFSIKLSVEVNKEVEIQEHYLRVECPESYTSFSSNYGQGEFPEKFKEHETDMLQRCIPKGAVKLQAKNNQTPDMSIEFNRALDNFAKIFNSDMFRRSRIIYVERIEPEEKRQYSPGKYVFCEAKITFDENKKTYIKHPIAALEKGDLKIMFDAGKGRIFWKKKELTKQLGVYTSLRSLGRWHDSHTYALWHIDENKTQIRASGKWINLPINQCWQMFISEKNIIDFIFTMNVEKKIAVDRLQSNIMLSENYKKWIANGTTDVFPDFKADIDDDWQVLWTADLGKKKEEENSIGVIKTRRANQLLPSLKFVAMQVTPKWQFNIVNSDIQHRARVLQCLNKEPQFLMPGTYPYFKGKIFVEGAE